MNHSRQYCTVHVQGPLVGFLYADKKVAVKGNHFRELGLSLTDEKVKIMNAFLSLLHLLTVPVLPPVITNIKQYTNHLFSQTNQKIHGLVVVRMNVKILTEIEMGTIS